MNTLIVYATNYGCTEKCATILSEKLTGKVDLCNLKVVNAVDLSKYDKVIIGGSIYMSKIQKEVREFCSKNLNVLKDKKIGLFICCMRDGNIAETQLNKSFPQELLANAVAGEYFGGEFIFRKMNFLDKLIVKKVTKIDKDMSNILEENINRFAQLMNNV
jgi:menaquinone-dependent protoporphyrinogen oxidase